MLCRTVDNCPKATTLHSISGHRRVAHTVDDVQDVHSKRKAIALVRWGNGKRSRYPTKQPWSSRFVEFKVSLQILARKGSKPPSCQTVSQLPIYTSKLCCSRAISAYSNRHLHGAL
eukprot:2180287-Amphidinium_carterae.1